MCATDVNVLSDCTLGLCAHCKTLKVSALKDNTGGGNFKKKKKMMHGEQANSPPDNENPRTFTTGVASICCCVIRFAINITHVRAKFSKSALTVTDVIIF